MDLKFRVSAHYFRKSFKGSSCRIEIPGLLREAFNQYYLKVRSILLKRGTGVCSVAGSGFTAGCVAEPLCSMEAEVLWALGSLHTAVSGELGSLEAAVLRALGSLGEKCRRHCVHRRVQCSGHCLHWKLQCRRQWVHWRLQSSGNWVHWRVQCRGH